MKFFARSRFKKMYFAGMLFVTCLVFGLGQLAEAREFELGDIPLDEETYQEYLKEVPLEQSESAHPTSYDARDDGIVTSPKNQGSCGSCWAFASVGALESHILKTLSAGPYDLSEQQLLSCNSLGYSCAGGSSNIIQYWETTGPVTESCFPYTALDTTPCSYSCSEMDYSVTGWHTVAVSEWNFKDSCYNDGPSYFRFNVYSDFYTYWQGGYPGEVYQNSSSSSFQGGHAVLIIGWDDAKGAYLCKNSWGATAGPNGDGTFWIAYSGHYNSINFGMVNFDVIDIGGPDYSIDIKANGSDGPITLITGDTLSLAVTLDPGDYNGAYADWWIAASTPIGWWTYVRPPRNWEPGLTVVNQTFLYPISSPVEVLNINYLIPGEYIFYFAVDEPDGIYSPKMTGWIDSVIVNITEPGEGLIEDFNDGIADNWVDDDSGAWSVVDGIYRCAPNMLTSIIHYSLYNEIYNDFSYAVDVRRTTGSETKSMGIIFRSDGTYNNCYVFHINAEGYYLIFKRVDGVSTWLVIDWTSSSAINIGANVWNRLQVDATGSSLQFSINDTVVQTLSDSELSAGEAGVKAYGSGADVDVIDFDNAVLSITPVAIEGTPVQAVEIAAEEELSESTE